MCHNLKITLIISQHYFWKPVSKQIRRLALCLLLGKKKQKTIATSNTDRTQGLSCLLAVWKGFKTLKEWGIIGRAVTKNFHSHTDVFRVLTQHWKKDLLFPVWTAPKLFQKSLSKYFWVRKYHPVKCLIYRPLKIFPPLIERWVLMTSFWNFSHAHQLFFILNFALGS